MVSMATHNGFKIGCAYKLNVLIAQVLLILDPKLGTKVVHMQIIIFINIYVNIKNMIQEWGCTFIINTISMGMYLQN